MAAHHLFSEVPQEVLDNIAYILGSDSFLGPPASLVPLLATNRELHSRLGLHANPYLYAQIFRCKFDTSAAGARFGSDRLTSSALASELRRRCIVLKRLRCRLDSTTPARIADEAQPKMPLREVLFIAYNLILEDEGKNMIQLQEYGRIHEWIREFWFDPRGSSLAIYSARTGVWPLNTTETALGMWLFWFLFNPEQYWKTTNGPLESPLCILKAMAFGAHTFNLTTTSWIHYDPHPCEDVNHFTLYSENIKFAPPPLSIPAILSYFCLSFPSGPGRLVPIAPQNASLPHPSWKEWGIEWARCIAKPERGITECFLPGSMEGIWEGFFSYTEFGVYASALAGAPPSVVQRSVVGRHKQTWKLREYHLLCTNSCGSDSRLHQNWDDGVNARALPGGDPLRSYFPNGTQLREAENSLIIQYSDSADPLIYHRSRQSQESGQGLDGDSPRVEVRDVIVIGEGHSAWGQFTLIGRIRPCDGLVSLLKDYTNGGRGQWLYRAYLVGNITGTLAGRWRDTLTPAESLGYEGCFIMCRRR